MPGTGLSKLWGYPKNRMRSVMIRETLCKILPTVSKPARYTGNELNAVRKNWDEVQVRMVFAFPDVYEVGMSHMGGRILYGLVNNHADFLMERTFAPWPDMEEKMRENGIPLFSLESFMPVGDFDVVGFSLQYELSYSNVLNMLDLAGIPLLSRDRDDAHPLVIAGGPSAFNPEPLADFIDAFIIGDGEEAILQVLSSVRKSIGRRRHERLKELAAVQGVYVPAFYEVKYNGDGTIAGINPRLPGIPNRVKKAVIPDLDQAYFPVAPVVPYLGIIHDRAVLEVMRGCQRGCRFCQAGIIYRPARERTVDRLMEMVRQTIKSTGFDEVSLASLSSADYSGIQELTRGLIDEHGPQGIGVALPSLRADAFSVGLAQEVQRVRKTTLTFAPEAGTQRLRDVINKNKLAAGPADATIISRLELTPTKSSVNICPPKGKSSTLSSFKPQARAINTCPASCRTRARITHRISTNPIDKHSRQSSRNTGLTARSTPFTDPNLIPGFRKRESPRD
jgi:radical SAM family uncharacterized protein